MHDRESDLKGGDRQIAALDEIEADFENVRAAWEWAVERRRLDDLKLMDWAVWWFLEMRSRYTEGWTLFQSALNVDEDRALHGRLMHRYAFFCREMGRRREWDEWSERSLSVAREMGEPGNLALVLRMRSLVLAELYRDFEQAHRLADEGLELWRAQGDTWGEAFGLQIKGIVPYFEGDYSSALLFTEESLKKARIVADRQRIGAGLLNTGTIYSCLGEPHQALHYYQESLAVFREMNSSGGGMAIVISNMGGIAQHLGDYASALQRYEEALTLASEWGLLPLVAMNLLNLADVLSLTGRYKEAADHMAECRRVTNFIDDANLGAMMPILEASMAYRRGDYDQALQWARVALTYSQAHPLLIQESYCRALLGLVEVKLGHRDIARQHLRAGLPSLPDKLTIMRAVYGLAGLAAAEGCAERAVEWAALVHHHQAAEYEFKVYAGDLLAELQAVLPPDVYAAAVERGAALDPDVVVAAFLQEEN